MDVAVRLGRVLRDQTFGTEGELSFRGRRFVDLNMVPRRSALRLAGTPSRAAKFTSKAMSISSSSSIPWGTRNLTFVLSVFQTRSESHLAFGTHKKTSGRGVHFRLKTSARKRQPGIHFWLEIERSRRGRRVVWENLRQLETQATILRQARPWQVGERDGRTGFSKLECRLAIFTKVWPTRRCRFGC